VSASEATFTLAPTVLVRAGDTLDVVTVQDGDLEALIVFRVPDDAAGYQQGTPKHAPAEGFERVGMKRDAIAALLDTQGIAWVAMPEPWTGKGGVDLFAAADFLAFLDECEPAG